MTHYSITSATGGQFLGIYAGETPEDAARAMRRAAGINSDEEAASVLDTNVEELDDDFDIVVVKEI